MSLGIDARVVWKPLNSCIISVPSSFIYPILDSTNLLVQEIIFHISDYDTDQRIVSLGWSGNTTSENDTIEIDTQYAKLLGIKENSTVRVDIDLMLIHEMKTKPSSSTVIEIEPVTTADWELTEIHAQAIESNFLSQVRCVRRDQKLLVHANPLSSSNTGPILFKVANIKNDDIVSDFAKIGNNTELHIIPKPHGMKPVANVSKENVPKRKNSVTSRKTSLKSPVLIKRSVVFPGGSHYTVYNRVKNHLYEGVKFVQINVLEGAGTPRRARRTFDNEKQIGISESMFGNTIIANYVEIPSDSDLQDTSLDIFEEARGDSVMISPLLAVSLGIEGTCGEKVVIEPYNRKSMKLDINNCKLIIHKFTNTSKSSELNDDNMLELKKGNILEKKKKMQELNKKNVIAMQKKLLELFGTHSPLTNGMKLPIIEEILPHGGILNFESETLNRIAQLKKSKTIGWTLLGLDDHDNDQTTNDASNVWKHVQIKFGKDVLVPESRIERSVTISENDEVYAQEKKIELIRETLSDHIPVFLYGKSGSGKSLLVRTIVKDFKKNGVFTKVLDFSQSTMKDEGDSEDSDDEKEESEKNTSRNKYIVELLEKSARQCFWHSPSLLVLENIDSIIPKEVEHGDNGSSTQITEILMQKFEKLIKERYIVLLATGKSKDSVNEKVFQRHFLDEEIHVEAPNKHQISEILLKLLENQYFEYLDYKISSELIDIASELDGYLPIDLKILIDRAFHVMISNDDLHFEKDHFLKAIEGYTPTSLRGVKLEKSTTNWTDIGGLSEVKRILLETLEWPTKYAPIFSKCTLRLRSGILLYGYPGCGKTMLASAISSQCGLNFISVKGPEILNKYIGASEQSVRELFERAQSAKPCILFFDEFDSIAPKRGHDSTGVTDRIVNQLLTQMDGAEGLDGVYVLAATSRPDLIDSALLRPGRLDKSIICDLPNYEDRLDILKTIVKSNKFCLQRMSDLEEISRMTYGYTGADLQAVVYNAYLKSVHVKLDLQESEGVGKVEEGNENDIEFLIKQRSSLRFNSAIKKKIEVVLQNMKDDLRNSHVVVDNDNDDNDDYDTKKENEVPILITLEQLKESLSETKKSISVKEFEKLSKIYGQFESSKRPGEMKSGEGSTEVGVRTSLM